MPSKPSSPKQNHNVQFESLGTWWYIESENGIALDLEQKIHAALEQIDKTWSRFRNDSLVAKIAKEPGIYKLNSDDQTLLEWYYRLYNATNGAVSPLIGQTIADTGYDATYTLSPKQNITKTPPWDDVLQLTTSGVKIKRPWLLDVGAAGKGFAVDTVAALFANASFIIDAGGDICVRGPAKTIGLEHPNNPTQLIGTVTLENKSVCGSAINRRVWGKWHHIINPHISRPVKNIIATWVIGSSTMHADGLATALFFVDPAKLQSLCDFSYIIMYENGEVYHTDSSDIIIFK